MLVFKFELTTLGTKQERIDICSLQTSPEGSLQHGQNLNVEDFIGILVPCDNCTIKSTGCGRGFSRLQEKHLSVHRNFAGSISERWDHPPELEPEETQEPVSPAIKPKTVTVA